MRVGRVWHRAPKRCLCWDQWCRKDNSRPRPWHLSGRKNGGFTDIGQTYNAAVQWHGDLVADDLFVQSSSKIRFAQLVLRREWPVESECVSIDKTTTSYFDTFELIMSLLITRGGYHFGCRKSVFRSTDHKNRSPPCLNRNRYIHETPKT